jgi:hypothetical protein
VTPTAPNCVGISPLANEGAVLQINPAAGVFAGTRFEPLITIKVFCAMFDPPLAVLTDVITEPPPVVPPFAPASVTAKEIPAMEIVTFNGPLELFAAAASVTLPDPVPELAPGIVIQLGKPVAVQEQALVVWTFTVILPPAAGICTDVGLIE